MAMTSQEQLDAFLAHCAALRSGYTFKFNKKTSSLRALIKVLEGWIATNQVRARQREDEARILAILKEYHPKDHVKYIPAVKSLFAVWGTNRDYVRLMAGASGANVVRYWFTDNSLGDVPQGIAIASSYPGYHEEVRDHLNALYQTAAGRTVLDALAAAPAQKRTSIVDHVLSNQCGSNGSVGGMNRVALELYGDLSLSLGVKSREALGRVAPGAMTRNAWLARQINQTPRYKLKGVPAAVASNMGVTEQQVAGWVNGTRTIWDDFGNDNDLGQIKNAVIVALYATAEDGPGCGSMVNYTLGDANPLNSERPPAIGLAHELIHAYFNLLGKQPGFEVENPTTVLFEYLCVGLGPWQGAAVCENSVRAQWRGALLAFGQNDTRNRKMPGNRDFYSPP